MHTPDQTPITTEERFAFVIDVHRRDDLGEEHPVLYNLVSVLVGDQKLGLISSLKIEMHKDNAWPEVVIRFLEGCSPEVVNSLSAEVQGSVRKYVKLLKKLPFIRVECPLPLDG